MTDPSPQITEEQQRAVNTLTRIFPYVWPHRRKVYLSFLFAGLVALFWSLNLSVAFPVVKVLLQGQSLNEYVETEIQSAEKEIQKRTARINDLDAQIATINESETEQPSDATVSLLRDRSRQQQKISDASRRLHITNWIKSYVVPILPGDQFDLLAAILGALLIATFLKGICVFIQDVLVGNVVELTAMGIRKQCFRKLLELDLQTLSINGSSDLMSRFTHDLGLLSHSMRLMGGKIIREPLKAICCITGAFFVCWQLTLLSLLFVPLVGFVFYRIGRQIKLASKRMMESMSRIYKTLDETLVGAKIIIAFNGARRHRQRFHRENKEYLSKARKIVRLDALTSPTTETLGLIAVLIALLPGAYLVLRETKQIWGITLTSRPMDIAGLTLLYVLLAGVLDPVRKLSTTYAKLKRGSAAADRIFSLMDQKSLVVETKSPKPMSRHVESIEFDSIEFAYKTQDENETLRPTVLNNATISLSAGEVVAVVGENGSGKSTIVNLLPRYFDPDKGTVRIDGTDIRDFRLRDLRSQIGIVTQETLLFDESIYENIRYGSPHATEEQIKQAAKQAHVTPFVEQLPDRFETSVGEKGNRLSGGQRQRIALARAILRDPAILILDEATSAIDAHSENLIHETLREFVKGRTTFLITHSASQSTLDFITKIIVMKDGEIVANGPHQELITSSETYQQLYNAQLQQQPTNNKPTDPPTRPSPTDPERQNIYQKFHTATHRPEESKKADSQKSISDSKATMQNENEEAQNEDAESPPHIIPLHTARRPHGSSGAAG